jgi:chromosome segregation ATPase
VSALVALVTGVSALRAGLRLRRTRAALRSHLYSEINRLTHRATELEESLSTLDARAQALPVRVSELQQNLAALRVLTNALGTSLPQAQKVLSFAGPRSHLARAFGTGAERSNGKIRDEREDETPKV